MEETGLCADPLELISITPSSRSRSLVYTYPGRVSCDKTSVRLRKGETVDYQWVGLGSFLSLIKDGPVLAIQYPRFKAYLDKLAND